MAPDEVDLGIDGLPAGLAEDAAARILAAGDRGAEALAELTASWPQYEPGLRRVAALLAGTDRALASAFQPEEPGLPAEIGGHRVLRRLGEGSFGTVFLCAQERPVQREVAVKVLRPGAGDRQTLQRFAAERQLLASLHHPAITQVFDAGELPDGRPYFVMEHVAGEPLTAYCAARDLAIDARLRLFVDVCRGVAHAHRRGVVHRDLKPANVLVVDTDEGPRVKVIDFGIAKALHQSHAADGVHTDAGRVVGTPGYMSPEQAAGEAVDPRSDVFALGVMLYELATGVLPWPRGAATTDTEPTRPSAKVAARDAAGGSTSGRQKLASELRGDLDWITLKALARDATRRYADAAELADDLDRHLRGEPVHAGPPSAAYRLRKLVRRHRAAALAAAIAGVLLCATIAIAVAVLRTTRTAAEEHFAEAKQVVDRLVARANDPRVRNAPQSDRTRQLLLEDARQSYDRFLRRVPTDDRLRETHCRTLLALSDVSCQLGEATQAIAIAEEARVAAEQLHAAAPQDVARRRLLGDARRKKGRALITVGKASEGLGELTAAIEHLQACYEADPEQHLAPFASGLRELASAHSARGAGNLALAAARRSAEVLEEDLRRRAEDDAMEAFFGHAGVLEMALSWSRLPEAKQALARTADLLPRVVVDRARAEALYPLYAGWLALHEGDAPGAQQALEEAVAAAARFVAQEPQKMVARMIHHRAVNMLAHAYSSAERWDSAMACFRDAVAIAEEAAQRFPYDPTPRSLLLTSLHQSARVRWDRYRREHLAEAIACTRRALEVARADAADTREPSWQLLALLALLLDSAGESDAQLWERVAAAVPEAGTTPNPSDDDQLIEAHLGVARSRYARGDRAGGDAALAPVRALMDAGRSHPKRVAEMGRLVASAALAAGEYAEAAAMADTILKARSTWLGKRHAAECLFGAWQCAARVAENDPALALGYRNRAAELYRAVVDELGEEVAKDPDDPWTSLPWVFASVRLAQVDAARGAVESARGLLRAALPVLHALRPHALADHWDEAAATAAAALARELDVEPAPR